MFKSERTGLMLFFPLRYLVYCQRVRTCDSASDYPVGKLSAGNVYK